MPTSLVFIEVCIYKHAPGWYWLLLAIPGCSWRIRTMYKQVSLDNFTVLRCFGVYFLSIKHCGNSIHQNAARPSFGVYFFLACVHACLRGKKYTPKVLVNKYFDPNFDTISNDFGDWHVGFGIWLSTLHQVSTLRLVAPPDTHVPHPRDVPTWIRWSPAWPKWPKNCVRQATETT